MRRRLSLRRETLTELVAADLSAVHGANTGGACFPSLACTQITSPTRCNAACELVHDVIGDPEISSICPETR